MKTKILIQIGWLAMIASFSIPSQAGLSRLCDLRLSTIPSINREIEKLEKIEKAESTSDAPKQIAAPENLDGSSLAVISEKPSFTIFSYGRNAALNVLTFGQRAGSGLLKYFGNAWHTRGGSLFAVEKNPDGIDLEPEVPSRETSARPRWNGLWQPVPDYTLTFEQAPVQWTLQLIPRLMSEHLFGEEHDIAPLEFQKTLVTKGLNYALKRKGKVWELTRLSAFMIAGTSVALNYGLIINPALNKYVDYKIEREADVRAAFYDDALNDDGRYEELRLSMTAQNKTPHQMRVAAVRFHQALKFYREFVQTTKDVSFENEYARLKDQVLFADIAVNEKGVYPDSQKFASFRVHRPGPLTKDQVRRLFAVRDYWWIGSDLIAEWVKNPSDPQLNQDKLLKSILGTNYSQRVVAKFKESQLAPDPQDRMTMGQLRFLLQRGHRLYTQFPEWEIMGVEPLMVVNGRKTDKVLRAADIESQLLRRLERGDFD